MDISKDKNSRAGAQSRPLGLHWVECICQECGKIFWLQPSRVKYGRGKHCSRSCSGAMKAREYKGRPGPNLGKIGPANPKWTGIRDPKPCIVCGKIFSRPSLHCSRECARVTFRRKVSGDNNPFRRAHPPPVKTCLCCGANFEARLTKGKGQFYCSSECRVRSQHLSRRALLIADRLRRAGFLVEVEASWPWLISPHSKQRMRVDIFLPEFQTAIEYDGRQHRETAFAKGEDGLRRIQERDTAKDLLLKTHSIKIMRLYEWPIDFSALYRCLFSARSQEISAPRQLALPI